MGDIVEVSPFRCRMWALHDRLEEYITEETCRPELESFKREGQLVPVLGRPVRGDARFDVELVYGARRLFVARQLNRPLRIEIREITDREALLAMDIENRQRQDISPYERGLSYLRALRSGLFESQENMARALRVSPAQISRHLKIARLPSVILNAFSSPAVICEGWGLELAQMWAKRDLQPALARTARHIARLSERPAPEKVFSHLIGRRRVAQPRSESRDLVVKGSDGAPLFRVRRLRSSVVFVLPSQRVPVHKLKEFTAAVAALLQPGNLDLDGVDFGSLGNFAPMPIQPPVS